MKHIIVGTDRPGSNSKIVSEIIRGLYGKRGETLGVLDMADIGKGLGEGPQYGDKITSPILRAACDEVLKSEGLIVVVPEYNGSAPGILKLFIDNLKFPESFEARPVCFVGLGGMFGGLRPVEHMQQVFGYRNAFIYPERVFLINVWKSLKEGQLTDAMAMSLLEKQTDGFIRFVEALKTSKLHANTKG